MMWTNIKEQEPDQYGRYLISNGYDVQMANHINNNRWEFYSGRPIPESWGFSHWALLPEPPNLAANPEQKKERLIKMDIADITMGDLAYACGYAEDMAKHGGDNAELYAAHARILSNAIESITLEFGHEYDEDHENHWFWNREWENC